MVEVAFWLSLCLVCVVFSGIFSGAETGMYSVSRLRLSVAAHRRSRAAVTLQNLLADRSTLLSTILLGTNVANYLAPVCLVMLMLRTNWPGRHGDLSETRAELYTTLILTPVIFIFGEMVPKNIFQRHADRYMLSLSSVLSVSRWLFQKTGLISVQQHLSDFMLRRLKSPPAAAAIKGSRVEMYQLLHEGAAEGNLTRTQIAMLESAHKLSSTPVATVMVPLARVIMLEAESKRSQIGAILRLSRHARMPVYQGDRRRVVGLVHLLDIIDAPPGKGVSEVMWTIVKLTPRTTVLDALSVLQKERRRMAAIEDASGRCIGIVTVKDLVEELVGELSAW